MVTVLLIYSGIFRIYVKPFNILKLMNLLMKNLKIETVSNGNRIADQKEANKYLRYELRDPLAPMIGFPAQVSFEPDVIQTYEALLPKNRGGLLPDSDDWTEENIDIQYRSFTDAVEVEYDLGGEYVSLYTSDIVDADGTAIKGKKKGNVIRDANGMPKIRTSVNVLCRQTYVMETVYDETTWEPIINPKTGLPRQRPVRDAEGNYKRTWLGKFSPTAVGESRKRLMMPLRVAVAKGLLSADEADAPAAEDE
jgi:hypothetical protein